MNNRMTRPPVGAPRREAPAVKPAPAPAAPAAAPSTSKFGRPAPAAPKPAPVVAPPVEEEVYAEEVYEEEEALEEGDSGVVTTSFTVSSSVTVKVKDNYFKFEASETKEVIGVDVNIEGERIKLADSLNAFLDGQVAELMQSLE